MKKKLTAPAYIQCLEKLNSKIKSDCILDNNINSKINNGDIVVWSDEAKSKFKTIADNNTHVVTSTSTYLNGEENITIDNNINADDKWFVKVSSLLSNT